MIGGGSLGKNIFCLGPDTFYSTDFSFAREVWCWKRTKSLRPLIRYVLRGSCVTHTHTCVFINADCSLITSNKLNNKKNQNHISYYKAKWPKWPKSIYNIITYILRHFNRWESFSQSCKDGWRCIRSQQKTRLLFQRLQVAWLSIEDVFGSTTGCSNRVCEATHERSFKRWMKTDRAERKTERWIHQQTDGLIDRCSRVGASSQHHG